MLQVDELNRMRGEGERYFRISYFVFTLRRIDPRKDYSHVPAAEKGLRT
jgi:hypothetical protein